MNEPCFTWLRMSEACDNYSYFKPTKREGDHTINDVIVYIGAQHSISIHTIGVQHEAVWDDPQECVKKLFLRLAGEVLGTGVCVYVCVCVCSECSVCSGGDHSHKRCVISLKSLLCQ